MANQPPGSERRVAPRYPLIADTVVTDLNTDTHISTRTSDISQSGCYLDTMNPFPGTTPVRVRITHNGQTFEAIGEIPYAQPNMGMGVHFTEVSPDNRALLQKWLAEVGGG